MRKPLLFVCLLLCIGQHAGAWQKKKPGSPEKKQEKPAKPAESPAKPNASQEAKAPLPKLSIDQSKSLVLLYPEQFRAFRSIIVDTATRSFPLEPLPDTLTIRFAGADYLNYSIILPLKGDSALRIGFQPDGSGGDTLQYLISPVDIAQGELRIGFGPGRQLIRIGSSQVAYALAAKDSVSIRYNNYYQQLLALNKAKRAHESPADSEKESVTKDKNLVWPRNTWLQSDRKQEYVILQGKWKDSISRYWYYAPGTECKTCRSVADTGAMARRPSLSCDSIANLYNEVFKKPCPAKPGRARSAATSLKYRIVVDAREQLASGRNQYTYLKLKNSRDVEYYKVKKHIAPKAGTEVQVDVITRKYDTSDYLISVGEEKDYFLDGEGAVSSVMMENLKKTFGEDQKPAGTDGAAASVQKKDSAEVAAERSKKNVAASASSIASVDTQTRKPGDKLSLQQDSNAKRRQEYSNFIASISYLKMSADTYLQLWELLKKGGDDSELAMDYLNNYNYYVEEKYRLDSTMEKLLINAAKRPISSDSLYLTARIKTATEQRNEAFDNFIWILNRDYARSIKVELLSLHEAFKQFKHDYYNVSVNINGWIQDLTAIKMAIVERLQIPVVHNAKVFAEQLSRRIYYDPRIDQRYYSDFAELIDILQNDYYGAIHLPDSSQARVVSRQFPVPNSDYFRLSVDDIHLRPFKNKYQNNLNVSCGFQIDFSTGFFVTGLSNPTYSIRDVPYVVSDATFRIDTVNGIPRETIVYTNRLDTVRAKRLIKTADNKATVGAGFMIHAYTRTGSWYNGGLALGLMYDQQKSLSYLVGLSAMLHTRVSRIALSGGLCFGKQNKLSDYSNSFVSTSDAYQRLPVNQTVRDVPQTYALAEPQTETVWTTTWFLGLTFNLASLSSFKPSGK